jgi:hypothetical protein
VTRLLFDADCRLCEEQRVLAFVAADSGPDAVGRLVADDIEQTIVAPLERGDWRCDLLDDDGRQAGGFRPFRLRRGGRLRSGNLSVSLLGHSWSHDRWSLVTGGGQRIEATVECAERGRVSGRAGVAIVLDPIEPVDSRKLSAQALVLAFGCWLIAQWHTVAPGDHMLTSTGAGGELAGALGSSARGGSAPARVHRLPFSGSPQIAPRESAVEAGARRSCGDA